ncbi:MAG: CrcB family protein [Bifidobacterium sp.]|nr:CrcB family protein [Bifidobacterium sp.]
MTTFLLAALGGGFGAMARWRIDLALRRTWPGLGHWATFIVNMVGSFLLGIFTGLLLPTTTMTIIGVGYIGGFTTMSTASVEAVTALTSEQPLRGLTYLVATLAGCVAVAALGLVLTL